MSEIRIEIADLGRSEHQEVTLRLLGEYSMDPMGDGKPLSEVAQRELIPGLRRHPTTLVFLAYQGEEAVGLAICFLGFSTFAARPLVNIHDYYVRAEHRGMGIGRRLMEAIERHARELGCCKLTLEVQENNRRARALYEAAGFAQMMYVPEAGGSLNMAKGL